MHARATVAAHHSDSVVLGPGATDDGMSVATILETMRAMTAAQAPRNTVEVLLTDAEEPGQLGAQAFADSPDSGDGELPGTLGPNWQHFCGPDSNVYELVTTPR